MVGISSKGVYGLAAMYVLAHAVNQRSMQVREVAAMTQISHGYLEQLLSQLRKSGLVNSTRGANGGYKLSRKAHDITVLEIIEALEGPLFHVDGNRGASLILESFWSEMEDKVRKLFALKLSDVDQMFQPYHFEI